MQGDYIASGDFVNRPEPSFSQNTPQPSASESQDPSPSRGSYTPPVFYDDPELVFFAMRDGPRLPPATRKLYEVFASITDPETGYSAPTHEQLAGETGISVASVKEHLGYLGRFGKIKKTHRSTPQTGTLPNAYYFCGLDTGLVPQEMNDPCSNLLAAADEILRRKELAARDRRHAAAMAAEKDYTALLEEALKAAGIDLPERPEPPPVNGGISPSQNLATPPADFVVDEADTPPSQNLATPPLPVISDRHRRVAEKVRAEWSWMHLSFERINMNINGAIRYFSRDASTEEDLEFQIANYHIGEEAKNRPRTRPRYGADDGNAEEEQPQAPMWDGSPPDPEAQQLWRLVLGNLQMQVPRPTFETWLRPTEGMAIEDGPPEVMTVCAPTPFVVEWLERRMFHSMQRILERVAGRPMELHIRVRAAGCVSGEDAPPQEVPGPGHGAAEGGEADSSYGGGQDA